jgi:hypothetical protein
MQRGIRKPRIAVSTLKGLQVGKHREGSHARASRHRLFLEHGLGNLRLNRIETYFFGTGEVTAEYFE